jgi:uncharacterized membrane protein
METVPRSDGKVLFKKLFRYFIQGLLIIAPIAITIWAILTAFNFVDDLLPNLMNRIFPSWIGEDASGNVKKIPGLGFVVTILLVIGVGYVSHNILMGSLINFFDQWMTRTPVIKFLYTSTKDFFEAFAGDKRKFNKAVLANVFSENVWIVGFLTDEEMQKFELGAEQVGVYVPQAYNFAGQLYILPRHKVRRIDKITAGEAMKYAVTGGVVDLDAERVKENKKVGN